MSWLEGHIETLRRLGGELPASTEHYRDVLGAVVREVAVREGVTACFVCFDGLLVERAGSADFEALAAMAQQFLSAGKQSAVALSLGPPQQLLLIGSAHKLALLVIHPFALGVLSPATVRLASALA